MVRELRDTFQAAQAENFGNGHAAISGRAFEMIAQFLIIFALGFQLDKQSDAKRFFVPLSRKLLGESELIRTNAGAAFLRDSGKQGRVLQGATAGKGAQAKVAVPL